MKSINCYKKQGQQSEYQYQLPEISNNILNKEYNCLDDEFQEEDCMALQNTDKDYSEFRGTIQQYQHKNPEKYQIKSKSIIILFLELQANSINSNSDFQDIMIKTKYLKDNLPPPQKPCALMLTTSDLWSSKFYKDVMKKSEITRLVKEKETQQAKSHYQKIYCRQDSKLNDSKTRNIQKNNQIYQQFYQSYVQGEPKPFRNNSCDTNTFNTYEPSNIFQSHQKDKSLIKEQQLLTEKERVRQLINKCDHFVNNNKTDRDWITKQARQQPMSKIQLFKKQQNRLEQVSGLKKHFKKKNQKQLLEKLNLDYYKACKQKQEEKEEEERKRKEAEAMAMRLEEEKQKEKARLLIERTLQQQQLQLQCPVEVVDTLNTEHELDYNDQQRKFITIPHDNNQI